MTERKSKTDALPMIGGVATLSLSAAFSSYCFILPTWQSGFEWSTAVALGLIGALGAVASSAVISSARHGGRWGWVGLGLGLAYLGLAFTPALAASTIHTYGFIALFVIWCAGMNVLVEDNRRRSGQAAGLVQAVTCADPAVGTR